MPSATIGVFGGSGFSSLLEEAATHRVETPYGAPSDVITVGEVAGRSVAFVPRHGRDHRLSPHQINYRANVWAMQSLGVEWLIGPCAAGSLQPHVRPGDFVIADQFVDRTWGRADTFREGPIVTHVSAADPYCPTLRPIAIAAARDHGLPLHERGTVVVIQGPRFSTRSESRWFGSQGWEVVNMTQYPEAFLARELGICYANISVITDYDSGVGGDPSVEPVLADEVVRIFRENLGRLRTLLHTVIERIPAVRACPLCPHALDHARVE